MGKILENIDSNLRSWIELQHMFFVATAPEQGHVNLSPKGYDTFQVIDEGTVGYQDLTGSGAETIAHVKQNGRITFMFCAFEGKPKIVRLYGDAEIHQFGSPGFDIWKDHFDQRDGTRSLVITKVHRVSVSCGFSIPYFSFEGERETLDKWATAKGDEGVASYWEEKNAHSIDGLEAFS